MGTLGIEVGEGRAPFTQSRKVMAPVEFRQGVGLGLGAKFLNDRLAGWPGQGLSPLLGTCAAKSSVSSKQEKS